MTSSPDAARRLWHLFEPVHALVYFAPEKKERFEACGLKGGWMGYFASRSAAMGAVSADVVVATFYNFAPRMVRRAIPDAWSFADPRAVLNARVEVVDAALLRVLRAEVASEDVVRAADLLRRAAEACALEGRPVAAAHASLAWHAAPHLVLWQAATILREFRGDGHVVALVAHGLDGCEANVMITAEGLVPENEQRSFRGWIPDEWESAKARLRDRGLLDDGGGLTSSGRALRARVEDLTDSLAAPPLGELANEELVELESRLRRINKMLVAGDAVPYPNPMGLPRAEAVDGEGD